MSRTHHHSSNWGPDHRFAIERNDRGYGFGRRRVGEAPGWHVRLYDHRPCRIEDRRMLRAIRSGALDADGVAFTRTGGRKPHSYYH